MGRWISQVEKVPTMEQLCQTMNGMALHKDEKKLKEYKKKIARYCLLAWTMCLTSVSSTFKQEFSNKQKYIEKGLLTEKEFQILAEGSAEEEDGWTDKWNVPISWATLMLNEGGVRKEGFIKKDHKQVVKIVGKVQANLIHITEHFENQVPIIMTQAVTIAVWGFLMCGVVSGQDQKDVENAVTTPIGLALILNFPLLQCIKYLLVFAWLRVALYLQNPFDGDDEFGIDLTKRLDFEIWKASFLTAKKYYPASLYDY